MKIYLLLLLLVMSCDTGVGRSMSSQDQRNSVSLAQLRSAPTQVGIDGTRVQLTSSLWVNVGPTMPPRSGFPPINGVVTAAAAHGTLAGKEIRIDHVWLLHGDEVWSKADPEEQDEQDPAHVDEEGVPRNRPDSPTLRIAVRNGPSWSRSSSVDVIVRLVGQGGESYLLRAPAQTIGAVQ